MLKMNKGINCSFRFCSSLKGQFTQVSSYPKGPLLGKGGVNKNKKDNLIKIVNYSDINIPAKLIEIFTYYQNISFLPNLYNLNIKKSTKAVLRNCSFYEVFPTLMIRYFNTRKDKDLIGLVFIVDSIDTVFQIFDLFQKYDMKIIFYKGELNEELLKECEVLIVYEERYLNSKDILKRYLSDLCFHFFNLRKSFPNQYIESKSTDAGIENYPVLVLENKRNELNISNDVDLIASISSKSYEMITVSI